MCEDPPIGARVAVGGCCPAVHPNEWSVRGYPPGAPARQGRGSTGSRRHLSPQFATGQRLPRLPGPPRSASPP